MPLECYRVLLKREPEPIDYLLADWIGGLIAITSLFAMSRVKDSGRALMLLHCLFIGGATIVGVAVFLFEREIITPEILIILVGLGLSLSITPFSGSLFDRIVYTHQRYSNIPHQLWRRFCIHWCLLIVSIQNIKIR